MGGGTGTGRMGRTALVVEDNASVLKAIARNLGIRGYDVTQVNYLESKDVPQGDFDLAIVDGLDGVGINVLRCVHAERKFLYTGSLAMETVAKHSGIEVHLKEVPLDEILGDEQ